MEKLDEEQGFIDRQVKPWCKMRHYPYECYKKFSKTSKSTLHNIIVVPQKITTNEQREKLLREMYSLRDSGYRKDIDEPSESIYNENQEIILSPLTPEEITRYFSRY